MIRISRALLSNNHYTKGYVQNMCQLAAANVAAVWAKKFTEENIEDHDFTIKCIMSHVLDVKFATLQNYNGLLLTAEQKKLFDQLCECRLARMPIQYIIGHWDFRRMSLRMIPPVFIPRPETEQLVDLILQSSFTPENCEFLEVGCGSGAICCSLLRDLPLATIVTLDASRLACNLTEHNARNADIYDRLTIMHHKVTDEQILPEVLANRKFDCIVSNPPYVRSRDIIKLAPEIKLYEDLRALDGGPDGMKLVQILFEIANKQLKNGSRMWLEVDCTQISLIQEILEKRFTCSLKMLNSYKDMYGRERFVEIERLS